MRRRAAPASPSLPAARSRPRRSARARHRRRFFGQADTRTLAQSGSSEHVPPASSVLVQPYSVPLRHVARRRWSKRYEPPGSPRPGARSSSSRQLALDPYPAPAYRTIYLGDGGLDRGQDLRLAAAFEAGTASRRCGPSSVTYVVLKRYNDAGPGAGVSRRGARRDGRLVATFSPYRPLHVDGAARPVAAVSAQHRRADRPRARAAGPDRSRSGGSTDARLRRGFAKPSPAARARVPLLDPPAGARIGAAVRAAHRAFLTKKDGHAGRLPPGVVYEATMRCNLTASSATSATCSTSRASGARSCRSSRCGARFPDQARPAGQPDRRRDLHAQGHPRRHGGLPRQGLRLRLPDDQRHDHHRGARRGAGRAGRSQGFLKHISVSIDGPGELHDKARGVKGTFERTAAGLRRLQAAATSAARAAARQHQHHRRARDARRAARDGGRRRGARRRRHRPEPPDVQHAGRSRRDRAADRRRATRRSISTFVTADPGLDPARVRQQVEALAAQCRERGIRFDMRPKVQGGHHRAVLHARHARSRAAACIRFSTRACRSAARRTSARSSASKSAT